MKTECGDYNVYVAPGLKSPMHSEHFNKVDSSKKIRYAPDI